MGNDIMRDLCINQGYVPAGCTLPGELVFALANDTGDPCKGCNGDRAICKGRAKDQAKDQVLFCQV